MGSFTAIGTGGNLQDKTYLREIEDAVHQRCSAADVAPPAWAAAGGTTNAGDNIQQASFWSARQQAVADIIAGAVNPFVIAGSYGNPPTTIPNVQNLTAISAYTTGAQVWSHVTGNSGGPRRCTTTPGVVSGYGLTQAGDILGPWLIEDLQLAMRFLRYTRAAASLGASGWSAGAPSGDDWQSGTYDIASSWWAGYFDRAITAHDGTGLKPWALSPPFPFVLTMRNRLYTSGPYAGKYYYRAQSYRRCSSVTIAHPEGPTAQRRVHLAGIYLAHPDSPEDGYVAVYTTGSPRPSQGRYGLVCTTAWHTDAEYTIPMNTLIPRTFQYLPRPGGAADTVDAGFMVMEADLAPIVEWAWNYA